MNFVELRDVMISCLPLAHQFGAGRMIRTVNLPVAVQAASADNHRGWVAARQAVGREGNARVAALRMTGLTQQRRAPVQQRRVYRSMRIVAQGTVFADRRVFVKVGSLKVRVATPAQLVDRVSFQQGIGRRMVRVVTRGAGHDAEPHRVYIGFYAVGMLVLVAVETHLGLCGQHRDRVGRRMDAVTIRTGDVVSLVHAAGPRQADVLRVAVHAHRVLVFGRGAGLVIEADYRRVARTDITPPGVIAAGTMTTLALLGRERRVGVCALTMCRTKDQQHAFIVMAGQAGLCADAVLLGLSGGREKKQQDKETRNRVESFHGCPIAVC